MEPALSKIAAAPIYLDVRNLDEHGEGRISGSINIPFEALEARLSELEPLGRPIFTFCRSGRRSALAATLLRQAGFEAVADWGGLESAAAAMRELG